jgi:hypothetical protein
MSMDFDSKLWRESVVGDWQRSYPPAGRASVHY